METLLQDLRFGLRSLAKTPRLTFAALACIAIGIGATMSVFTLINAALVRQLPFPDAGRLVRVWATVEGQNPRNDLSYLNFVDIAKQAKSFDAVEAAARARLAVRADYGAERMRGEAVTPGYFRLIGVSPALGRLFAPNEYPLGAPPVLLLSDAIWHNKFGGRKDILGARVRARSTWDEGDAQDQFYTVVGVMPPGFLGTIEEDVVDFWIPIEHFTPHRILEQRDQKVLWTIAHLRPGVALAAAQAEVDAIGRSLAAAYRETNSRLGARVEPFGENWREKIRPGLYLLVAAAVLLLAIACTNIANLLLARLARREHELTLRMVLGARRGRVLRQLLTESLLLAVLGGLAGVVLAYWGIKACIAIVNFKIPSYLGLEVDWRLLAVTATVIVATGLAFGVMPALLGSGVGPRSPLSEAGRGATAGRGRTAFGQLLVGVEIAFTFVLLIGAALMLRSYLNLAHIDLGYRSDNLLRMSVTLDRSEFPGPGDAVVFAHKVKTAVQNHPGVDRVSVVAGALPPWRDNEADLTFDKQPGSALRGLSRHSVDPDFLSTLDVKLVKGRNIEPTDGPQAPRVALLSESLAHVASHGRPEDAIGKSFNFVVDPTTGRLSRDYEIVGVVKDVLYMGPRGDRPNNYDVYLSLEQVPDSVLSLAVHTKGDPNALIGPLQREISQFSAMSPVHWVGTMQEELGKQYADARFYAFLIVAYSLSAVILAVIGVYGVLSNAVTRRYNELGVRMAIGAQPANVLRLVLGQGMRTVLVGIALGLALYLAAKRVVASLLFGVGATDAGTFAWVAVALLALGLVACYFPARRATRVDPVEALRHQ
jgi:putative ABC transport system permease protein